MSEVLTITTLPDPHVEMVQDHMDAKIINLDPRTFLENMDISYHYNGKELNVTLNGSELNNVGSIWFRKPLYLNPEELPVKPQYQEFAHAAYKKTVKALYDLYGDRFWISDFRNVMKGNNKVWQIEMANSLGFDIPKTLVTSNAEEVERFRLEVGDIVTKSLTFSPVHKDGKYYGFFTTIIESGESPDLSGLFVSPAIFQRAIEEKIDLRLTVVGNKVFPCAITPTGSVKNRVDWRMGIRTNEVQYEIYEDLDDNLIRKCVELTRRMGLHYSAIDLAIDVEGKYWFLEINPNGQWAFIELETGMPISKSIANLLSNKSVSW